MRHEVFTVPIDDISDNALYTQLESWLQGTTSHFITTPNPEFILAARKNSAFLGLLKEADLSLPDGVGLCFAVTALTDQRISHRHTGVSLVEQLVRISERMNKRVLLFGGDPGAAERTKTHFSKQYPGAHIEFLDPGMVTLPVSSELKKTLQLCAPDVLLVALGQKKQEAFIQELLPHLPSVRIAVGVGGAFEMFGGLKPRSPVWMQNMGLEWVWRALIEPTRIRRTVQASIVFPIIVISATLRQHRFLRACRNVIPEIYRQLTGGKSKTL